MKKFINLALILSMIIPSQAITVIGFKHGLNVHLQMANKAKSQIKKTNFELMMVLNVIPYTLEVYLFLIFGCTTIYSLLSMRLLLKILQSKIEII